MKTEFNKFSKILDELKNLLGVDYGRFSNYQQLAPCVNEKVPMVPVPVECPHPVSSYELTVLRSTP